MAALSELWRKAMPVPNPYEELDVEDLMVKQRNLQSTIALYKGHLAIYNAKSRLTYEEYCRKSELERGIEAEECWLELCTKTLDGKKKHKNGSRGTKL